MQTNDAGWNVGGCWVGAGMTGWPNWHYKVLTLYGGYLAFNALGTGLKRIVMDIHEGTAGRGTGSNKWRVRNRGVCTHARTHANALFLFVRGVLQYIV